MRVVKGKHEQILAQFGQFSDTGQDEINEEEEAAIEKLEFEAEQLEDRLDELKRAKERLPPPL